VQVGELRGVQKFKYTDVFHSAGQHFCIGRNPRVIPDRRSSVVNSCQTGPAANPSVYTRGTGGGGRLLRGVKLASDDVRDWRSHISTPHAPRHGAPTDGPSAVMLHGPRDSLFRLRPLQT
jgi:hypothetical protein